MVLNLINTSAAMGWSLKTIYEMPSVTVNDTNNVRQFEQQNFTILIV